MNFLSLNNFHRIYSRWIIHLVVRIIILFPVFNLHGCFTVNLPDEGSSGITKEAVSESLIGEPWKFVIDKIGHPTHAGRVEDMSYYLYEKSSKYTEVNVWLPFVTEEHTRHNYYCLLLEFDDRDILREYTHFKHTHPCLDKAYEVNPRIEWSVDLSALRDKAKDNNPAAQLQLFELFSHTSEGHRWLCRSADQGHQKAQIRLADIYYHGWFGFDIDHVRSYLWFRLASDGDDEWSAWADTQLHNRFIEMSDIKLNSAMRMLEEWRPGHCERDLPLMSIK